MTDLSAHIGGFTLTFAITLAIVERVAENEKKSLGIMN